MDVMLDIQFQNITSFFLFLIVPLYQTMEEYSITSFNDL